MPKYVIQREVPNALTLGPEDLRDLAAASNAVLDEMDGIQWVHSYVRDGGLFCVYNAADEALIAEHARRGGFPCNRVMRVSAIIDPVTGER